MQDAKEIADNLQLGFSEYYRNARIMTIRDAQIEAWNEAVEKCAQWTEQHVIGWSEPVYDSDSGARAAQRLRFLKLGERPKE